MSFDPNRFPQGIFLSHYDLPRPVDWHKQFGNDRPLHLEIGFGFGEFLIQQAGQNSAENFIGIEQDWARMARCLSKIATVRQSPEKKRLGENIRLLRVDATVALQRFFPPRLLDHVTCLFPCPWPKKSHSKYRLFSRNFLVLLNSRLRDKGSIKLVTDWRPYLEWVVGEIEGTGFESHVETIAPQFNTKFERKWIADGQKKFWQLDFVKTEPRDAAVIEDIELRALFAKDFDPRHFVFENIVGETSVIFKDFIFDPRQNLGLVRLIVAEPFLTQHVWVAVIKTRDQWCVAKADGHNALPTSGVALAIERVGEAVAGSIKNKGS